MSISAPSTPMLSIPPYSTTSTPRLQALYSDFSRQKQSNPTSYHSNIEWWRKGLEVIVSSGLQTQHTIDETSKSDRLVLHAGRELLELVKLPRVGKPLALGAVISELRSTKSIISFSEFMNAKVSIYDPGWLPVRIAAYVVGKPLWWALEQMGIVGEEGLLGSGTRQHHHKDITWWGDYVMISIVEGAADAVMERQEAKNASAGDALYTMESFRKTFAGVAGGDEDVPLRDLDAKTLLKYLERDRQVVVVDKDIIKFVEAHALPELRVITAVDRGILELKSAIHNLHTQVEVLQSKIDECTRKASSALQQKRKSAALTYIRSRKQLEDLLSKRLGSLSTLESTFISVEAAVGDIEIMKSYDSSAITLRAILAHPSLQRDSIDKTMDALSEANLDAREVDDAVRMSGDIALGTDGIVDDDELEAEWKALVDEAETAQRLKDVQAIGEELGVPREQPVADPISREPSRTPVTAS
ncbi:hypothetical protein BYT27DRAFT_7124098 [Phlegmacium glaucopus]|nr:hypothetical protein BYT27DRAFT_7124098 [Phlegmacium glaucopus]